MSEPRPRVADLVPRMQLRGAEVFAQHLEFALRDRYDIRLFACYGRGPGSPVPLEPPLSVSPGVPDGPLRRLRATWSLRTRVGAFAPDVVVAHGGEPLRLAAAAGLGRHARLVYVRVSAVPPVLRTRARMASLRAAYARADAVVAVSDSLRRELVREFGLEPERVRVIRNGRLPPPRPSSEERIALRREFGAGPADVLAVWVGRFVPEKDPLAAVALARQLSSSVSELRMAMIGDGPLKEEAARAAEGFGNVTMSPARADSPSAIAAADVVVSTSRTEGAPGVFVEALLAGVPVVTPDSGGVRDVVTDGENGIVVPPGDLDALAEAVSSLALDPLLRSRLADGATRDGAAFDIRRISDEYDDLYRELLARRRP